MKDKQHITLSAATNNDQSKFNSKLTSPTSQSHKSSSKIVLRVKAYNQHLIEEAVQSSAVKEDKGLVFDKGVKNIKKNTNKAINYFKTKNHLPKVDHLLSTQKRSSQRPMTAFNTKS